jgi:hypothetical protein
MRRFRPKVDPRHLEITCLHVSVGRRLVNSRLWRPLRKTGTGDAIVSI